MQWNVIMYYSAFLYDIY